MNEEYLEAWKQLQAELVSGGVVYAISGSIAFQLLLADTKIVPSDIDILVEGIFLRERSSVILQIMKKLGYTLVNLREIIFARDTILVNFAPLGSAGIQTVQYSGHLIPVVTLLELKNKYEEAVVTASKLPDIFHRTKLDSYRYKLKKITQVL